MTDTADTAAEKGARQAQSLPDKPGGETGPGREADHAGQIDRLLAGNPVLWRGCDMAGRGSHGQPTGYPQLDEILPGRGWPRGAMVEIVCHRWGMGELQLLVPLMRQVVASSQWVLWISPPYLLYTPALLQAGIDAGRVLAINLETSSRDALWSMEKALQTGSCGLVLAWHNRLPHNVVRRLQLAAEAGRTLGVLFQHHDSKHSHSFLRLKIEALPALTPSEEATADSRVTVLRARGNFRPLSACLRLHPQRQPLFL